jgi:DHA3 family tetracycline resistance protein-like MFS transporter
VTAAPEEALPHAVAPPSPGAFTLLRRPGFRRVYLAVGASQVGDAFQYIALMWAALLAGGPLGVLVVRLADSVPALVFGFHGGVLADRAERRRMMVAADLLRAAALVPVAVAGLAGSLPLWALIVSAFVLTTCASYFDPAYGAVLPALAGRDGVQAANALVRASADALWLGGSALAAALLTVVPLSAFFAVNAGSFLLSALLLSGLPSFVPALGAAARPRVREAFTALRPHPWLAAAVATLGVAVTISSGTWIVGVPELVRRGLDGGAGRFALLIVAYALGSIGSGVLLARRPVARKARASLVAWCAYLPAYLLLATAHSLGPALAGALVAGAGQGAALVLTLSAAQSEIPDTHLGRVTGLISLVHRGAHATGLLLVSPLFAVVATRSVFVGAAFAIPLVSLSAAALAARVARP